MLDITSDKEVEAQIDGLNLQAWSLKDLDRDHARSLLEQVIALSQAVAYPLGWASAQITLAFIAFRLEHYADALERIEQATPIFKAHSVNTWLARAYFVKGTVFMQLGDRNIAHDYFKQQLKMGQQLGDLELQALANAGLGHHATYENLVVAQQHFEQALEMFRDLQNAEGQALVLYNLALLHYTRGELDLAKQLVKASFVANQSIHLELHSVRALALLGLIASAQGQAEAGLTYINEALEIANLQQPELIPMCLLQIGKVSLKAKLYEKALPVLKEALRLSQATGNLGRCIECHQALAEGYAAMNKPKEALQHRSRYEELTERMRKY